MLMFAANHTFFALIFKVPNPVAKFLLFCLIYRLKAIEGKYKKGIDTRWMDHQGLEERAKDKPSVYKIF